MSDQDEAARIARRIVMGEFDGQFGNAAAADLIRAYRAAQAAQASVAAKELREENDRLRAALANSKDPCVYCQLPAEKMAECRSGFPGCDRADDMGGCPERGAAFEAHFLREERDELKARAEKAEALVADLLKDKARLERQLFRAEARAKQLAEALRPFMNRTAGAE